MIQLKLVLATSAKSRRRMVGSLWLAIVICAGCGQQAEVPNGQALASRAGSTVPNRNRELVIASRALQRNDFAAAEATVRNHLLRNPADAAALELSGDIASRRGDTESAIKRYRAAVDESQSPSESLMDKLAMQLMAAGRAFDTLGVLEERIERYPSSAQARSEMVGLAAVLGWANRALPSLRWLSQHGQGDAETLQVLANPRRVEPDQDLCQTLLQRCPGDLRPQFSLARLDAQNMEWSNVAQRLQPVLEQHRDFVPAYTLYGLALIELRELERIPQWQQEAPPDAESSPEYWLIAGMWSQHHGKHAEAARAFWEAIRRDHTGHYQALSNLSLSLRQIGREQDAQIVADQITRHSTLSDALKTHLERSARSQRAAMRVADAMTDLGRLWEAEGWARLAVSLPDDRLSDIRGRYMSIRTLLTAKTPWQSPDKTIAGQIDLSDLPLLDWIPAGSTTAASESVASGDLWFEDEAERRGWVHTCEIAPETVTEGHWIHQTLSGGVGVIDFDLDGWPDLAAAMLNGKALKADSSPNQLFRNLGGKFSQCTIQANYLDTGFGQGITVGDFNDDGFPDIFDANIGHNRLFRNNGDGTFQEVSSDVGLKGDVWTTSAVLADIDGDGFADLYEAAYCSGREPYEQPCRNRHGIISTCPPLKFEAELDHVWRGKGDGTFVDVTTQWMQQASAGRGLGVLVGLFDERPGLDLYIANDMTVNHLWSGSRENDRFQLTDLGAVRGVGLSGRSTSQASMGMAAGDPDGDGDIDFFLTHFADDHNTYYEQVGPGLWTDRSFQVGLSEPSMKLLGFGTEWVDFDNNGKLELIIANGHVDDVDREDIDFRMPPQLFWQDSSGRWIQWDREKLGEYFATDHLGRALATLDADRDGRVDVAITHLYDPVSLLMNRTEGCGQSIGLELKSTKGQRDAIGATVITNVGGRDVTTQLTAGDGFMCSNQRRISLGTGNAREVKDVAVIWPSGTREEFGALTAGQEYLLVEGSGEAFQLQGAR